MCHSSCTNSGTAYLTTEQLPTYQVSSKLDEKYKWTYGEMDWTDIWIRFNRSSWLKLEKKL